MRDPSVVTSPRGQEEKSINNRQYALLNDTNSAKNDNSDHNRPPKLSKSPVFRKTSNDNAASNPSHQSCTDSSLSESSDLSESSGGEDIAPLPPLLENNPCDLRRENAKLDKTVADAKATSDGASKDGAYHRAKGASQQSSSSALRRNNSNAKRQIEPKFYVSLNNLQLDFSTEWLKRILLDRLGSNNNILSLTKYTRRDACVKVSSEAVQRKAVRTLHRLRIGGRPLSCRIVANPRKLFERYGIYKGLVEDLSDASNYSRDNSISDSSSYYSSSRHHSASSADSSGHDSCSDYSRKQREPAKAHKSSRTDSGSRQQQRPKRHHQRSRSYSPGSSSGSVRGSPVYEEQGGGAETACESKRFGRSFDRKVSRNDLGNRHDPMGEGNRLSDVKVDRGIRNFGDNQEILSNKYQYLEKPDTEPDVFHPTRQKKEKIFKIAISATNQDVDASQSSKLNQAGIINKIDEMPNCSSATPQDQKPPANVGIVGSDTNATARPSMVEKPVAYSPARPVGNVFGDANSSPEENSALKSTSITRKQQSRLQNLNKSHDDLKNYDKLESVSPKVRKQARGNDDDAETSSFDRGKTKKASHNLRSDPVKRQSTYYRHRNERQRSESLTSSSSDTSCSLSSESTSCTRSSSPSYISRSPRRNNLRHNRLQYRNPPAAVTTNTKSYNILDGEAEKSETFITRNFSSKTGAESSRSETESNIDSHQMYTNDVSHHSNQEVVEISKQINQTAIGLEHAQLPLDLTAEDFEYIIEIVRKLSVILRDPKLEAILPKLSGHRSSRADEANCNGLNSASPPPCASDVDLDYSKLESANKDAVNTLVHTNVDRNLELDKIHQEIIGRKESTVAPQVPDANAHEIRRDLNVLEIGRNLDKSSNLEYCVQQDEPDLLDSCSQNDYDESCGDEGHSNEEVSAPMVKKKKYKEAKNQIRKRKETEIDNYEQLTHKSKKHKGKHSKHKSRDKDKKFKKMIQKALKQKLGSATKKKSFEENSYQSSSSLSNANHYSKDDNYTDDDEASAKSFSSQESSIESRRPNKFSKSDLKELLKFYERSKKRPKRVSKSKEKKSREIEAENKAKTKLRRATKSHKLPDRAIETEIPKKLELGSNSKTSIDKSKGKVKEKEKDKSHAKRKASSKRKHAK
ncbi:MAG: hypothetical protein MHMPM18_000297 [Marteilia pararefringens]